MKKEEVIKFGSLIAVLIPAALIIKPFISTLLLAAIVSYGIYPFHKKLIKKIPRSISSLLITSSIIIGLIALIQVGTRLALNEMGRAYTFIANINYGQLSPKLEPFFRKIMEKLISWFSSQIGALPDLIITMIIFFIAMFYMLYRGEKFYKKITKLIPINTKEKNLILTKIKNSINAFIYIQLSIGILQGIVAATGFMIFGIEYVFFAAIGAALLSIIPVLGSAMLYLGASIILILSGRVFAGIGLLIFGIGISGTLDVIIKPMLFGRKIKANPLLNFIGIFGGLKLLGIAGAILGPVILSVAYALIEEILRNYNKNDENTAA